MSKPKTVNVDLDTNLPNDDFSSLTDEQTMELLEVTLRALALKLESSRVDPELITAALFELFADRMAQSGDREQYESILEQAMDLEWEDYTLH